jgi:uncharacterized membrane protein
MIKKCLVVYLIVALFVIGIAPRVDAAFSPSDVLKLSDGSRAMDIDKIRIVLENKLVTQRLADLGFTTEEIVTKLADMTDDQIHQFAQKLDDLKVGGDGIGLVIGVLVIVILVIIILQLTGRKVVVTK